MEIKRQSQSGTVPSRGDEGLHLRSRIHITGASGSGVSTLGRAVASAIGGRWLDSDDYYWLPTDPPYVAKRAPAERVTLLREAMERAERWILSGSLVEWGDPLVPFFDLVVFLYVPTRIRLARLRIREQQRLGPAALEPGTDENRRYETFLAWAGGYDDSQFGGRSLAIHESWLACLPCPVLRIEGNHEVSSLVERVLRHA
jgi:adenylate kinase family enzyme